jgi:uncharacterized protein (DUF1501 family)
MKNSRRRFLQNSALGIAGLSMIPRFSLAQSSVGTGKNVIVVNLYGGLDGMAAFPYIAGRSENLIRTRLRPTLTLPASQILTPFAQNGIADKVGVHPSLKPLVDVAKANMAVVQRYGIPGDPGRSHDTCQVLMSLGASKAGQQQATYGYLARLMDVRGWDSLQYWALVTENPSDTNTKKLVPMKVGNLSELEFPKVWGENDKETEYITAMDRAMVETKITRDPLEASFKATSVSGFKTLALVRSDIGNQVVGGNVAGDYDNSPLGESLRDTAKLLKAKKTRTNLGLATKDMLILTGQGGYDTHSDQSNPNLADSNLSGLLRSLGKNLAVLYKDLELIGLLSNTVVVVYSEFGRTNYENGTAGNITVGTDHGHGSTTFMIGGPVRAGVYGTAPSESELLDVNYNALKPGIDYRDVLSEVVRWLGVSPSQVFTESTYTSKPLGIIA